MAKATYTSDTDYTDEHIDLELSIHEAELIRDLCGMMMQGCGESSAVYEELAEIIGKRPNWSIEFWTPHMDKKIKQLGPGEPVRKD